MEDPESPRTVLLRTYLLESHPQGLQLHHRGHVCEYLLLLLNSGSNFAIPQSMFWYLSISAQIEVKMYAKKGSEYSTERQFTFDLFYLRHG